MHWLNKAKQYKNTTKISNPFYHHSSINHKRAKNNNSRKGNVIVKKGEKEKEYEKTKGKKSDYERRKGKRTTIHNEVKEENRKKGHRKGNKNNKR